MSCALNPSCRTNEEILSGLLNYLKGISMTSVLMILSAADHWTLKDGSKHPTGFWAEEFLAPYNKFKEAGWDVVVATPGGKKPTVDQTSLSVKGGLLPNKIARLKDELARLAPVLDAPENLSNVDPDAFDVVFYPGGHAPMEDLAYDEVSGAIIRKRMESGRLLALLCHAPAAILAAQNADGTSPFAGYKMTGLSNAEETLNGLAKKAKWLLEDKLEEAGVEYQKAKLPMRPHVVVDRNVYTGQNPQSSEDLADRIIADVS